MYKVVENKGFVWIVYNSLEELALCAFLPERRKEADDIADILNFVEYDIETGLINA